MGDRTTKAEVRRPQFFEERAVPDSATLPEEMVGMFTFVQDSTVLDREQTFTRRGILTPEGWVPPAPRFLVHRVSQVGDGPNDLRAMRAVAAGKKTRVAMDPRKLKARLADEGKIIEDDNSTGAIRSPYRNDLQYFIPENLDTTHLGMYLKECVRPVIGHYLDENDGVHPPRRDVIEGLAEQYGVDRAAAKFAVELEQVSHPKLTTDDETKLQQLSLSNTESEGDSDGTTTSNRDTSNHKVEPSSPRRTSTSSSNQSSKGHSVVPARGTDDESYPDDWDERRRRVYQRDDYQCRNCGANGGKSGGAELHAHHVVPLSKGGSNRIDNLVTLCSECHQCVHGRSF